MKYNIITLIILMLSAGLVKSKDTNLTPLTEGRNTQEIYFAGGCFWGTEHFFKQINGVESTEVGYANGKTKNPTYDIVSHTKSGYAETVKVRYDPEKVALKTLIELYFKTIDPTSLNRQGNDIGEQYRTGIYYKDEKDLPVIKTSIAALSKNYLKPLAIEVKPLTNFYKAEDYHQDYLDKNPQGYCHIDPALFEMARKANQDSTKNKGKDSKKISTH
ncbi:peptide-methionine (S)-S-oxide reductase MsrA [Sphingobacterium spiritivorum]|uniref:peptide-methionine (S)-S-oxide reductase MsrA n=1 Tax=Sphingobacterium spiritivorum TaxID=258 RepID=UPI003DA36CAB